VNVMAYGWTALGELSDNAVKVLGWALKRRRWEWNAQDISRLSAGDLAATPRCGVKTLAELEAWRMRHGVAHPANRQKRR
jgi:hypothetical protein